MADYDAIVVGAGLAGSTAAYCMAKEGLSVLILERGDTAGSKNVTGGWRKRSTPSSGCYGRKIGRAHV